MKSAIKIVPFLFIFILMSCQKDETNTLGIPTAYREIKSITYNNVNLNVVIDKPLQNEVDVLIVYHGTVLYDNEIIGAANNILDRFKEILDRNDIMIVSVAYPGENMLLGDNIVQAEAALLWVKNNANQELGITVKKVFLAGHSQGGYLVTRLNTMHQTNGVIANAPGPLNLVYRCQLEENGQIQTGATCTKIKNVYGTTTVNPTAYMQRSLLNFTTGFKSDILFVQGLSDSPIQMYSWPTFKQDVMNCTNCQNSQFLEIVGGEHSALFTSPVAKTEFNNFMNSH
jgi:alpha/beta hydrolase fold